LTIENLTVGTGGSRAIGGEVYFEWDRDHQGHIVGGMWRREIAGQVVERDVCREGDRVEKDTVMHDDGRSITADVRVVSVPGAKPMLLQHGSV